MYGCEHKSHSPWAGTDQLQGLRAAIKRWWLSGTVVQCTVMNVHMCPVCVCPLSSGTAVLWHMCKIAVSSMAKVSSVPYKCPEGSMCLVVAERTMGFLPSDVHHCIVLIVSQRHYWIFVPTSSHFKKSNIWPGKPGNGWPSFHQGSLSHVTRSCLQPWKQFKYEDENLGSNWKNEDEDLGSNWKNEDENLGSN